jgi:hypothetical protein
MELLGICAHQSGEKDGSIGGVIKVCAGLMARMVGTHHLIIMPDFKIDTGCGV